MRASRCAGAGARGGDGPGAPSRAMLPRCPVSVPVLVPVPVQVLPPQQQQPRWPRKRARGGGRDRCGMRPSVVGTPARDGVRRHGWARRRRRCRCPRPRPPAGHDPRPLRCRVTVSPLPIIAGARRRGGRSERVGAVLRPVCVIRGTRHPRRPAPVAPAPRAVDITAAAATAAVGVLAIVVVATVACIGRRCGCGCSATIEPPSGGRSADEHGCC